MASRINIRPFVNYQNAILDPLRMNPPTPLYNTTFPSQSMDTFEISKLIWQPLPGTIAIFGSSRARLSQESSFKTLTVTNYSDDEKLFMQQEKVSNSTPTEANDADTLQQKPKHTIKRKAVPIRSTSIRDPPQGPAPTKPLPPIPVVSKAVPITALVAEKRTAASIVTQEQEIDWTDVKPVKKLSTKVSRHFKLPSLTSISSVMSSNSSSASSTNTTTTTRNTIPITNNKPLPALPPYRPVQAAPLSPDFILCAKPKQLKVPGRFGPRTSTSLDADSALRLTTLLETAEESDEDDRGCCGLSLPSCFSAKKVRKQRERLTATASNQGGIRRLRSRRYTTRKVAKPNPAYSTLTSTAHPSIVRSPATSATATSRRRSRSDLSRRASASFTSKRTSVYSLHRIATMLEEAIPFTLEQSYSADEDRGWESNATTRTAWDGRYLPVIASTEPGVPVAHHQQQALELGATLSQSSSMSTRTQSQRRLTRQKSVAVRVKPGDVRDWKASGVSVYRGVQRSQELRWEGLVRAGVCVV